MKYKLRRFFREEREKIKKMSFKQAVGYIWQYFGLFIVLEIALIWLTVWGISRLIAGPPEYWIYAAFANTPNNASNGSRIWRDFVAYSGYDTKEKRVEFSNNMFFDYTKNKARGNEYYNSFVALVDSGTLDLVTMPPDQLVPLGQSGRLLDLNLEQCAELREKYADRLLYYEPSEEDEQTEPIPVAIDISDSRIISEYNIYGGSCALAVSANSQRLDAAALFLDFIFSGSNGGEK